MKYKLAAIILPMLATLSYGLDASCEPLVNGFKNRIAQPAYSITNKSPMGDIIVIKINGKKYMGDGKEWELRPDAPDETDLKMLEDIKNDKFPVTDCKLLDAQTLDSKKVTVLTYTLTMSMGDNVMKIAMKQYTDAKNGLVYKEEKTFMRQVSLTEYSYTDIKAPKIK